MFRRVRLKDPLKSKQLQKGLKELSEEGATQVFMPQISNDLIVELWVYFSLTLLLTA